MEEGREQQWLKELERNRRVSLRDSCNSPLALYQGLFFQSVTQS